MIGGIKVGDAARRAAAELLAPKRSSRGAAQATNSAATFSLLRSARSRAVRTSTPSRVTSTVCSNCALRLPSAVRTVHLSLGVDLDLPAAEVDHRLDGERHPRAEPLARAALAVVLHLRRVVELAPDAVADEVAHDAAALALDVLLDGRADVAEPRALAHLGDARRRASGARPRPRGAPRRSGCRCRTWRSCRRGTPRRCASRRRSRCRRSASTVPSGMPWQTMSLTLVQTLFGKPL